MALSYEATSQIRKWQLKNPHPNFQHYLWFDDKTTFNYNKTLLYVTYPIQPGFEGQLKLNVFSNLKPQISFSVFRNHFEICSTFAGHKLSRDYLQILKSSEKDSECKDQVLIINYRNFYKKVLISGDHHGCSWLTDIKCYWSLLFIDYNQQRTFKMGYYQMCCKKQQPKSTGSWKFTSRLLLFVINQTNKRWLGTITKCGC